ncbi:DUF7925 domain-containing protein [Oceanithermus sp.]
MKGSQALRTLLFLIFVLGLGAVLAVGTPAGTEIRNQASASYIDSAGQPQTTTSNEVITVVQPVYGFSITPDGTEASPGQTKSGLAGAPVYFNYIVTNTGNTTDTIALTAADGTSDNFDFTSTAIYLDANCNGQVDSGEATVSSVTLAADASACLVVEAVIPSGQGDGDYGNLNIEGTSQGDTTKTDTNNWARAVVTSAAVISATKSADPSGSVAPGGIITYTISGSNTGGSAAGAITVTVDGVDKTGILVSDPIPAGTTFYDSASGGSVSGSAGAGTATVIYQTASGWTATEPTTASDVTAVGLLIEGADAFFPQGAQFTLSFQVQVDADAAAGSAVENTANVEFDANGDGDAEDTGESVDTNTTTNTVATVAGVQNGPQNDPDADGTGFDPNAGYTDPTGTTWYYTETTGDPNDAETIDSDQSPVYGGDTVYFENTLKNTGNASDSYTLSLAGVPSGWTCQLMAADGTTPISGPVGPIAPTNTFNYVVKCSIPADEVTTSNTEITVTATSENDPAVSNPVKDVVPAVQPGYGVDIAQHDKAGDSDDTNDNPTAQSVDPGATVLFPFDVYNSGNNPDTYDLTAQLSPNGFPSTIYPDANCDGVMDDPVPNPVTSTDLMASGDTACFILSVEVPADQAPGSEDVTITATSNANPSVTDNITTTITVNAVVSLDFTPDRSGTVTSPGTIVYTHTLTNNGNTDAAVTFSVSGSTHPTWTYQISTDGGSTWYDPADASVSSLGAGASQEIQVRVIVPDGEPIGAVDVATVTATSGSASASVTDTTTVVGGDLRLEKQVDKTEAVPGDTLTYTITASNIGTADLKQVIISDPLPSYTTFESVSASITGFSGTVLYSTDGSTWNTTAPTSLNAGEAIYVAVDTDGDNTITDADLMPAGTSITITFKVTVQ